MSLKAISFFLYRLRHPVLMLLAAVAVAPLSAPVLAAPPQATIAAAQTTYETEWVYRVKWGHDDEFWRIFQKTQVPVLDKQKELGYILNYEVYRPGLHTSEDSRWTYRIVIQYKDLLSSTHESEVTHQLFPDRAAYRRDENRRWELVEAHYDLPIHQIDPHASD